MAEWALYLDETGSPEAHSFPLSSSQTPIFTIAGVALPIERWREYDRSYLYSKRQFFSAEINRSSKTDCVWEVKGSDLVAPRNSQSERNKVFVYRVIELVKSFGGKVIGVSFLKNVRSPMPRSSIYTKGLQIIAERFDLFLRESHVTGIMILDSRMAHMRKGTGVDYKVAVSYLSFVFENQQGQQLRRIHEAPMFADSSLTAGLQIADIISSIVYTNVYAEKLAPIGQNGQLGYLDYSHAKRFYQPLREVVFRKQRPLRWP